jgi:CubicO group peptidase (beta-lactamase class C family)
MKNLILVALALATVGSMVGCGSPSTEATGESPDYWPTDGWKTSTPEQQGMDSEMLTEVVRLLAEQDDYDVHSLLIIRNGYIVTDAYFYPFAEETMHNLFSVTKSITATLIGIALDRGYIKNVDQPVLGFFPGKMVANLDAKKQAMTLEDLLTMQTGFDIISKPEDTLREMMLTADDWVQFTLDLPMREEPGTFFAYCSPGSHLLSAIIQQTIGMSALDFATEYLFGPLGISDVGWPSDPQGITHGWSDLHLSPHDMAKIGYLYLNGGAWDGQQIVPAEWVTAATEAHVDFGSNRGYYGSQEDDHGYGYQWWTVPEYYGAVGHGGQYIKVSPDRNLVVVLTGGGGMTGVVDEMLSSYVFPAAKSDEPLPASPDGVASLEYLTQSVATPPPAEPMDVLPLPETAHKASGKTYLLDANPFGLLSITLTFSEPDEALLRITSTGAMTLGDTEYEWLIGLDNVERFSPGAFDIPVAGKGSWETDSYFSAQIDETGSFHTWQLGLHFEGDEVICRLQDLGETVREYPRFVGRLGAGPVVAPDSAEPGGSSAKTGPSVSVKNSSPPKTPGKPGWWVIAVRNGPGSDFDRIRFLEPGDTAVAIGRSEAGDWLLLDDGGWVGAGAVEVKGDIDALPVAQAPPATGR